MKSKSIIWAIIIIVIIILFVSFSNNSKNTNTLDSMAGGEEVMMDDGTEESMMTSDEGGAMEEEGENMMNADESSMSDMEQVTAYELYDESKIARAGNGDVVLFFHASWCPTCRSLDKNINENITKIPTGLSILKVDYDKYKDLKKKYEITYQHTLVQVDKDGNMIKKWGGSPTLAELVKEVS